MKFYLIEKVSFNQGGKIVQCDIVVDLKKACELLGVSERTFYRHLGQGESKGFKISNYKQPDLRITKFYE